MTSAAKAPFGMALVGCGSAVPVNRVSNEQLSARVDTSDEWIRTRTGIGARRICNADEPLTVIATRAAEAALEHAGWKPEDLDLILMGLEQLFHLVEGRHHGGLRDRLGAGLSGELNGGIDVVCRRRLGGWFLWRCAGNLCRGFGVSTG